MKILKFILTIIFLIFLFIANLFFGNPISKSLANGAANNYIKNHYNNLDLEREETIYNFKDGNYVVHLQDKNSEDSKFYLAFDSLGKFKYDTYDGRKFNTYLRFRDELYKYGKNLEKKNNLEYELRLEPSEKENDNFMEHIALDEKVDINNFPTDISVNVKGYSKNPNIEEILKILQEIQKITDKTKLNVADFSIILIPEKDKKENGEAETWKNALSILNIPSDYIRKNDIDKIKKLQKSQNHKRKDN